MTPSIAFVGAGPTALYTLHALLLSTTQRFELTIFEQQAIAGRGTPYRPGWNDPAMLSNIASIEIPPLAETLVAWLERQPEARLIALGVDPEEIGDRVFYPRLALGEFFKDQFQALTEHARSKGVVVDIKTRCTVVDAVSRANGVFLSFQSGNAPVSEARFDHLVLATGHQWPEHPEVRPGYFLSPWPASALASVPACQVGIRGTSLTAIDAVVSLAVRHGAFIPDDGDRLRYEPAPDTDAFHMTMMSRKGLLPEADFFHPIPYEPLAICTPQAVEGLIETSGEDLLEDTFSLFKRELASADPAYAAKVNLAHLDLEGFCDGYFADRLQADPFVWAEQNLQEAAKNHADQVTVAWRYAILRMHEVIGLVVPHLDEGAFERFARYFKPVFVDDYATVPHESIKRLLALHLAGRLDVIGIGEAYKIDAHCSDGGATLHRHGERRHFPVFIEAIGQKPLGSKDFPFVSLRRQGIVRDEPTAGEAGPPRGIVIDDQFHLISDDVPPDQLFCLSLPYILGRHPFVQGITSSHEMAMIVAKQLAAAMRKDVGDAADVGLRLKRAAQ